MEKKAPAQWPTPNAVLEIEVVDVLGVKRGQFCLGVHGILVGNGDGAEIGNVERTADFVLDRAADDADGEVGCKPAFIVWRPELEGGNGAVLDEIAHFAGQAQTGDVHGRGDAAR